MDLTVIEIPQWQGSAAAGAPALAEGARLLSGLFPASHQARVNVTADSAPGTGEVRDLDALAANLAAVRATLGELPEGMAVTVGGDCGVELGPIDRAHQRYGERLAVVWFDAHGDLNTPDSSPSKAFHGMVLRTLLGEGPAELRPTEPLSPGQVVLAGVRALDPAERDFVAEHRIRHLGIAGLTPQALADAVAATGADAVYVHIDLDVLDPREFASVGVPEPDGLTPARLTAAVRALADRFTIAGLGITEYQPGNDPSDDQATLANLVPDLAERVTG